MGENGKKDRLLKRRKNIEGENEQQVKAIESQEGKKLNEINDWWKNKSKAFQKDSKTISRLTKNTPNLLMKKVKSH